MLSKTQIDKLGERLKTGQLTDADLLELDDYRRSFSGAYEKARAAARKFTKRELTGRTKSNSSIVEKLRRETIRLSQIQDIAGCRIVVANMLEQDMVVLGWTDVFFGVTTVINRRERPSHGYRAVHVVANIDGSPTEIQVRTELQQRWAEVSEKYSDVIDPAIKYGGGDPEVQELLLGVSADIAEVEGLEQVDLDVLSVVEDISRIEEMRQEYTAKVHAHLDRLVQQLDDLKQRVRNP